MPSRLLPIQLQQQQSESDCLAACASMLLQSLNVQLPYSQLLELLDVAPWGTPHRNLLHLADRLADVQVNYDQGTLSDLIQLIDAGHPVIVFIWTAELPYWSTETGHAVVISGYDETNFFILDPAFVKHPIIVSHGDLDLAWAAYDSYYAIFLMR